MHVLMRVSAMAAAALGVYAAHADTLRWIPVEDAVPVALLPPMGSVPKTCGSLMKTARSPEAYLTIGVDAAADAKECGGAYWAMKVAHRLPPDALARMDVFNAGTAEAALEVGFRLAGGGGFGYDVRVPPGRHVLDLAPEARKPLDGAKPLPSDPWSAVTGLSVKTDSRLFGGGAVPEQNVTIRDLFAVEAVRMRFAGGCPCPESRELMPATAKRPLVFSSKPNEFAGKPDARSFGFKADGAALFGGIPHFGRGGALVLRIRATCPDTKAVEVGLHMKDGGVWGSTNLPINGMEWQDVRLPFGGLRYFSHWGSLPPCKDVSRPTAQDIVSVHFCFGKWLCPKTLDKPHGFEIESVKVTQ